MKFPKLMIPMLMLLTVSVCGDAPTAPQSLAEFQAIRLKVCPPNATAAAQCIKEIESNDVFWTDSVYVGDIFWTGAEYLNVSVFWTDPKNLNCFDGLCAVSKRFGIFDATSDNFKDIVFGFRAPGEYELFLALANLRFESLADTSFFLTVAGDGPPAPQGIIVY